MVQVPRRGPGIREVINDVKIGRGIQLPNEVPTQLGFIMIHDHCFDIIHIQAQGIAEHENQDHWDKKGQVQTPEVPDQVVELFAGNGFDIYQFQLFLPDINSIKTSFRSASRPSGNISLMISNGLPRATIFPSLIMTIRSQLLASSI